jgi:CrcB protein
VRRVRRSAGRKVVESASLGGYALGAEGRRRRPGADDRLERPVTGDPDASLAQPEPIDPDLFDAEAANRLDGTGKPVRSRLCVLAAIAAGGALGAPARYELALALPARPGTFPLSTFVINVTGSFLLGALLTLIVEKWPPTVYLRPFTATGVLGAYTTWSTFMVDTDLLLKAGHVLLAVGYVVATMSAGLVAVYAGILAVRRWHRR